MAAIRRTGWNHRLLPGAVALLCGATASLATTYEIGPADDLRASVNALLPGDELVLRGGTYTITWRFSIQVSGTPAQPIVIRAKTGEVPILSRDATQNTINLEGVHDLVLRGLEIAGGSHGIRIADSSDVTVESCHVHDTADVGISANVPGSTYRRLRLVGNHVHHTAGTGEGFYLGCNNTGCIMADSRIEGNWIHDTRNSSQGDGIEIKQGSYGNLVRGNIIHDTGYPCILVYGTAGQAPNRIEQNRMWGCGDHGIQAAADAEIVNNVILGAAADGIHSQIHQSAIPGNLRITHNTVLNSGDALRLGDIVGSVLVANNALYSQSGLAVRALGDTTQVTSAGNVGTGGVQGIGGGFDPGGNRATDFVDAASGDVHLATGSRLIAAGDPTYVAADDFDGAPRLGIADTGAYRYAACLVGSLTRRSALRAVKTPAGGAAFSWDADPGASEHHVNRLGAKADLAGLGPHLADRPGGRAVVGCRAPAPAAGCSDNPVLPGPGFLFYQVLPACGLLGSDEGPPG